MTSDIFEGGGMLLGQNEHLFEHDVGALCVFSFKGQQKSSGDESGE